MNTIVMQIDSTVCNSMNAGASAGALQSAGATPPVLEGPSTDVPSPLNTVALVTHPLAVVSPGNLDINDKRGDTKLISSLEFSPGKNTRVVNQTSSTIVTNVLTPAFSTTMFNPTSPSLAKAVGKDIQPESLETCLQEPTSITHTTVLTPNRAVRSVMQPLNTVELMVKDKRTDSQMLENYPVQTQKIYNIVPTTQKNITMQKVTVNNNNNNNGQRLQTVTSVNSLQRGTVSASAGNPLKLHVVNSKSNLALKTPLQVQRQVMSNMSPKQIRNGTKTMINKPLMTKNSMVTKTSALMNHVQKSYKTVNRSSTNPNKTIKTLSPQSPQANYLPKTGIKTLSPQNHLGKVQNSLKMIPNQPPAQRMGIKTLAPQRPGALNNRHGGLTSKPNYIGKHAAQAHKAHKGGKGRGPQRGSPAKYLQKQSNPQSSFNQALTAQILQSLPQSGRGEGYGGKNYVATHSPTSSNLSEDIGEEIKPEMSPDMNYYYQVVMLDHNYSSSVAPTPAISPRAPESMGPSSRQPMTQQSPGGINGIPNTQQAYHYAATGKRHRLNSGSSLPPATPIGVTNASSAETQMQHDDDAASTISSETHRDHPGEEGEETETAPEGEGEDEGITRCICDYDHDDGYMICCDICSSWQHVDCMGLDREHIPEKYTCVRCEPRRVDRAHARAIQQRKREELAASDSGSSGSDTSTAESTGGGDTRHSLSLNNNLITKKRAPTAPVPLAQRRKSEPPLRRQTLAQKRQQLRRESIRESNVGRRTMKKREKKQVMKRKMKSRSSVDDDSQDSWPSPSAPTTPSSAGNLMQLRQWIENYEEAVTNHYSPELRARISNMRANGQTHTQTTTPTVGGVGTPAPPTAQQDVQVQKCRLMPQPLTGLKIVMANQSLTPNSAVIELRGKYMLSTQHRQTTQGPTGGLLTRQHSQQRPGPFLFFYRLPKDGTEVCVDTRTYGNDARFIRRSCRPNAELRHCVEKGTLHLYVVSVSHIEKNQELTIRHETHDLAAVGTTSISCACGNSQTCGLFNNQRKNGGAVHENVENTSHRKRRGRRTSSPGLSSPPIVEPPLVSPIPPVITTTPPAVTTRRSSHQSNRTVTSDHSDRSAERKEREPKEYPKEEKPERESVKDKKKKLTREERKMEAIMKAFERMEKAQQRKQEVQARQAQRRESDPIPGRHENGDEKEGKIRRKRRKGRARTVSTTSQSNRRRTRLNSTDSYITSGDEGSLLSPPLPSSMLENQMDKLPESPLKSQGSQLSDISSPGQVTTAAGLLLALASGGNQHEQNIIKSPQRDNDGNSSSSSVQSSPSTPLSSACLLVAAAVGPLEPGFKFPKTKKAIMNEWLNKSPEPIISITSPISEQPSINAEFYTGPVASGKSLATLVQAASLCDSPPQSRCERGGGNAKKRWLRQAISEECDSPCSRPESPPSEMVAPPKKRRLARESLSSEQSFTPPTTPTMLVPPANSLAEEDYPNNDEEFYTNEDRHSNNTSPPDETDFGKFQPKDNKIKDAGRVEIVYSGHDVSEDLGSLSEQPEMEPDAVLNQRVAEMRMEFGGATLKREETSENITESDKTQSNPAPSLLDPRLGRCERPIFRDSAQLLGTVEKTLRFYEESFTAPPPVDKEEKEKKPEVLTPAKRKLSISEYRQRKQISTTERASIEENTSTSITSSPGSPVRAPRLRSDSTSSTTSSLSSEEEISTTVTPIISCSTTMTGIESLDKTTGAVGFNSAPTAVELQRENVERLKKAFGLESSASRDSSITSPKLLLVSPPTISPANTSSSDIRTETSKYLLSLESKFNESKFSEPKLVESKFSELTFNESKFSEPKFSESTFSEPKFNESKFSEPKFSEPKFNESKFSEPKFSEPKFTETKFSETSKFLEETKLESKLIEPLETKFSETKFKENLSINFSENSPTECPETKFSDTKEYVLHKISPKNEFEEGKFTDTGKSELKLSDSEEKEDISDEKFSRLDDSFIPPFNNPVYPNSTQYTSYTSVIDSCPYEGRNPSPPPSEILSNTRIPPYHQLETSSFKISPNSKFK